MNAGIASPHTHHICSNCQAKETCLESWKRATKRGTMRDAVFAGVMAHLEATGPDHAAKLCDLSQFIANLNADIDTWECVYEADEPPKKRVRAATQSLSQQKIPCRWPKPLQAALQKTLQAAIQMARASGEVAYLLDSQVPQREEVVEK